MATLPRHTQRRLPKSTGMAGGAEPPLGERFFAAVLFDLEFPQGIIKEVVTTFGYQYGETLAKNRSLGKAAVGLLDGDELVSTTLLDGGNQHVLYAVLARKKLTPREAIAIMSKWNLSTAHQYQLAQGIADEDSAKEFLKSPAYTERSRSVVRAKFPELRTGRVSSSRRGIAAHPKVSATNDSVAPSRRLGSGRGYIETGFTLDTWPALTPARCVNYNGNAIREYLIKELGDGRSPHSRRAWMNFLSLIADDPDVPFSFITQAARAMSKAEGR